MQILKRSLRLSLATLSLTVMLAGCSSSGNPTNTDTPNEPVTITLVTHESFALAEGALEKFTTETGIKVEHLAAGDAGALANQLVLTKGSPLGDVVFGIDNNFAGRVVTADVLLDYLSKDLTAAEDKFLLPADSGKNQLTPITSGDVCVNVDTDWFKQHNLKAPVTLDDLIKPAYKGLFVTPGANTSSPGLAFFLATVAAFGEDGWKDYWQKLVDNEVKITAGWSDAYNVDFTASGQGTRPIVLSYGSSPAFAPTTANLDKTCYRQVEYAGVLAGTKHEAEAKQLVDFLFSVTVQNNIPETMWVFPANSAATLPEKWKAAVSIPETAYSVDPLTLEKNRDEWISEWAQIAIP